MLQGHVMPLPPDKLPPQMLPEITVFDAGRHWPLETLETAKRQVHALLNEATAHYPSAILRVGDAISRRWLARTQNPHLDEMDRIAAYIQRPGTYYFNISYEWGCSTAAGPSPDRRSARLVRVLDWPTNGLGRNIIAVRVSGRAGTWINLTWPGYTGVLQAMAPGRFAAAINQAPMEMPVGIMPLDWAVNRSKVWRSSDPTPAHLLRHVFEQAESFDEAYGLLVNTPIAASAIFTLSGLGPSEACVIERKPNDVHVIEGPASAANEWQMPDWRGRNRGNENDVRREIAASYNLALCSDFDWLQPPVRNPTTRLALIADAESGHIVVQGFESEGPATRVLSLHCDKTAKTH